MTWYIEATCATDVLEDCQKQIEKTWNIELLETKIFHMQYLKYWNSLNAFETQLPKHTTVHIYVLQKVRS